MTRPPQTVLDGVEEALAAAGATDPRPSDATPVGGGCINQATVVEAQSGERVFLKWNESAPAGFFEAEADGLRALQSGSPLRVPEVLAVGRPENGPGWLLLEYVPEGPSGPDYGVALGQGLAAMHRPLGYDYGWAQPNFIGSVPQSNPLNPHWSEFWREARLEPLMGAAVDDGAFSRRDREDWARLLERLPILLEGAATDGPSLLHGDLWSGNVYCDREGQPVVVDPAVYRGHREVDLAMAELFGGFPPGFLPAYRDARPVPDDYEEVRRDVYQLYPLLVHVVLFGRSYVPGVRDRVRRLLGA